MNDDPDPGLIKDEIVLPDGRYLIYYTFTDDENGEGEAP